MDDTGSRRGRPASLHRRRLLVGALGATVCATAPARLLAAREERLHLTNLHTGEAVETPFRTGDEFLAAGLADINRVLRDHRSGEVYPIDPGLLGILGALQERLGATRWQVISGYRSPATNAMLAGRSGGVARRSLHMQGRAIDVRLTGVATSDLRDAALDLGAGGVGYYARSDFVHLDTGRVRSW
jgi:uncharacterized protein YcbK (DUF882 family)